VRNDLTSLEATRRRPLRSRAAGIAGLTLALAGLGAAWSVLVPSGGATAAAPSETYTAEQISAGKSLYATGCASCHGIAGQGGTQSQAPGLVGVGAAAADFQISTGRMPLAEISSQAERKPNRYNPSQTRDLVAYVASLGAGPEVPDVNVKAGDLALGATLFRGNCANCHNFAGQGGALSSGKYAPALTQSTPREVGTAIRSGPESMPVFSNTQLSTRDVSSIAAYVQFLKDSPDPGGNGIGRSGPIPEGAVVFIFGIGGLCLFCLWIGKRSPRLARTPAVAGHGPAAHDTPALTAMPEHPSDEADHS
jgi:ubiquinol-cytochrome c reductase cytochrome c subunit